VKLLLLRIVVVTLAVAFTGAVASAQDSAAGGAPSAAAAETEPSAARADELDPATLFRTATEALTADRPVEAIAKLEALGDRGVVDPVVSYDRGLAYAARVRAGAGVEQAGDLGRAAHGFEEARELSRDAALVADATTALAAVRAEVARRRSRAGDPIEIESGVSLGRSIVKLLPENAWAALAAICSAALAAGIYVRVRARLKRVKVAGTTTCAVAGGLLLLTAFVVHSARDMRLHVREAIVVAPSTRLLDDRRVAFVAAAPLPEGARVQLLDDGADFARVKAGHLVGWLPSGTLLPMAK
jgi:hypothetical protein